MTAVETHPDEELLTTGQVANLLGSSRQHVVDLCKRGTLPYVSIGTHRRIHRHDAVALQRGGGRNELTREQRRSLWLNHAVAGKVVADPERALDLARGNLTRLRVLHPRGQAARWLAEWDRVLNGSLDGVLEALTSGSERAVELRQNSPFAGLLTDAERRRVLASFSRLPRSVPR